MRRCSSPRQRCKELNDNLRQRAGHYGHTIRPEQLPLLCFIYVAETQEQADREYTVHLQRFFEDYVRTTPHYLAPPGYLSVDQLKTRAAAADKMHGSFDLNLLSKAFFISVGTPDKVANDIGQWSETMQTTHINCVTHVADMPHWKTVKNLTLFAEEVMPRLRFALRRRHPGCRRVEEPTDAQVCARDVDRRWREDGGVHGRQRRAAGVLSRRRHRRRLRFRRALDRQIPGDRALPSGLRRVRRRSDLHRACTTTSCTISNCSTC